VFDGTFPLEGGYGVGIVILGTCCIGLYGEVIDAFPCLSMKSWTEICGPALM